MKSSNRFRFIEIEEIYDFASMFFLKKSLYKKEHIELWLDFIYSNLCKGKNTFIVKPFPPIYVLEKIKVVNEI
jgi:hypothetical protein